MLKEYGIEDDSDLMENEEMLFIYYPKCTTCQKAKKWLDEHNIEYIGMERVDFRLRIFFTPVDLFIKNCSLRTSFIQ